MVEFQRNWNKYGIGEPLLFPIKRAGQSEINLSKLFKEFFGFNFGKCKVYEFNSEIRIEGKNSVKIAKNGRLEVYPCLRKWTISENRGKSFPHEARALKTGDPDYLTLKDPELVQSLRQFISNYTNLEIDLAKIIGIGGEGTVLEEISERLHIHNVLQFSKLFGYQLIDLTCHWAA